MMTATAPTSRRIALDVTSDPANLASIRKTIESFCITCGFDERAVGEIGLCVNEALANVFRHAYNGQKNRPVQIIAEVPRDLLTITIRDWGNGIDPRTVAARPYDPLQPGGIGMICLKELMDEITYTPQRDGMLLTMRRRKR